MPNGLRIRKRADKSGGTASLRADLPGAPPGTWPLAGVEIMGDPPERARLSQRLVAGGIHEGWIVADGEQVVHRPGGPASNRWGQTHTFVHYDALEICGHRYRVLHQPDKYAESGDDTTPVTDEIYTSGDTRVDWFYDLELEA